MENGFIFSLRESIETFLGMHTDFIRKVSKTGIDLMFLDKEHRNVEWSSSSTIIVSILDINSMSKIRKEIIKSTGATKKCYESSINGTAWCDNKMYGNYFFEFGKSQLVRVVFCADQDFDYLNDYLDRAEFSKKKTRDITFLDPVEEKYGTHLGI